MKVRSQRYYSPQFKREAVQESIASPQTVASVAATLGIPYSVLKRWRRELTQDKSGGKAPVRNTGPEKSLKRLESENRKLQRQLERAKLENEILKKATEYFDKLPK